MNLQLRGHWADANSTWLNPSCLAIRLILHPPWSLFGTLTAMLNLIAVFDRFAGAVQRLLCEGWKVR